MMTCMYIHVLNYLKHGHIDVHITDHSDMEPLLQGGLACLLGICICIGTCFCTHHSHPMYGDIYSPE